MLMKDDVHLHRAPLVVSLCLVGLLAACGGLATGGGSPASQQAPAPSSGAAPLGGGSGAAKPPSPGAASAAPSSPAGSASGGAQKVSIGVLNVISDLAIFAGLDAGYFKEQGLELDTPVFRATQDMIAPMAAGQLDVGTGGLNAGLFNAIKRDIPLRVVADKATTAPGFSSLALVVRKDLLDSGAIKTLADIKGRTIALPQDDITPSLDTALKRVGVDSSKDVTLKGLGFADTNSALANKAVDAGIQVEPLLTVGEKQGIFKAFLWDNDQVPDHNSAVLLYAPRLVQERPEVGKRFMTAYVQSLRLYYDSFITGKKPRSTIIPSGTAHMPIKDAALWEQLRVTAVDPDGYANRKSLEGDLKWYAGRGLVKEAPDLNAVVDSEFVDYAVQQLGHYAR